MAVVIVVAYVMTRTVFFDDVLHGRLTIRNKTYLIVIFGCFAVYGTLSGIKILDAVSNTRYIGPVVAGLVGGPLVGLGAGLIGGIHRYLYGGFTAFSSGLSTVVAGFAAGLVYSYNWRRHKNFVSIAGASLCALIVQIYHLSQILVLEKPFDRAFQLVMDAALPMIITNVGGVAIFTFIVSNCLKESRTLAERNRFQLENKRIESELRVASDIQNSMVPTVFTLLPDRPEFDLYAILNSAKEVGGDLYDFALVEEENLYLAVGDVSDKGVPAALLMAVTKTLLKSMAVLDLAPDTILSRANVEISSNNDALMFITVFCGIINCRKGELVYSNAGHNPPLILRNSGEVEWLELPVGLVLGVDADASYSTKSILLNPGDTVVVYTDGVTEAMNSERQLFSEARLIDTARRFINADAQEVVKGIAAAVHEYADGTVQSDDITIMAIKYRGCGSRHG